MEMTAVIQYILTSAESFDSQDFIYNKSLHDDTWACWCIIMLK